LLLSRPMFEMFFEKNPLNVRVRGWASRQNAVAVAPTSNAGPSGRLARYIRNKVIRIERSPTVDDPEHQRQQEHKDEALLDETAAAFSSFAVDTSLCARFGPFMLESAGH